MEQDHDHEDNNESAKLDPNLPPLTRWERIEQTSKVFPLITGHRGQIVNNYLFVHGGFSGIYSNSTYKLNLDTLEWHPYYHYEVVTPPEFPGRQWHSIVKYNSKLYTFGGAIDVSPHQFSDMFEFDPATCRWQEIKFVTEGAHSVLPIPRYVHTAVVYKNGMYIHGGKTDINGVADTLEDFWRFDFDTRQWTLLKPTGDIPPPRRAHMSTVFENKMFIFGGWNGKDYFNDMYYYHFKKNYWSKVKQNGDIPPPRQLHKSVVRGGKMLMFGGKETIQEELEKSVYTGDLHEFIFSTSTWRKIDVVGSQTVARGGHLMFEYNNCLFALGGYDGSRMNSLWRLKLPEAEFYEKVRSISSKLKSDLRKIYQSKQYSDVMVQVDGQHYHFHSALLSVRCPALLSLIQSETIRAENISKKQMDILVEYIYQDQFKSTPIYITEMADMRDLAIKLDLPYLASLIENAVADILEPENLFEALSTFSTPRVQKRIREIYNRLIEDAVIRTLNFAEDSIMDVKEVPVVPPPNFSENLLELLRTGAYSDIAIVVDEQQIKLHQFVLNLRCPFFKGFSEFNQRTSGSALVHKPQMPITAFKALLQYVYGAKISCENFEDFFWLLQEGSYYMIDDKFFYKRIADLITSEITVDNANGLLAMANKFSFNGVEEIKQVIRSVIKE